MESTALTQMPRTEMEQRVSVAKWPKDLTVQEKRMMATVAMEYGLDPLMGELSIYQGKPYVCISGRRRKAQEGDDMDGMEDTRPATREERAAWGIPDGDYFFRAAVYKKGCRMPFVGWGRVRQEEIAKMQESAIRNRRDPDAIPVVKDPQAMAAKRAESQALMKGWHIPLPSFEDVECEVNGQYRVIEDSSNGNSDIGAPPEATTAKAKSKTTTPAEEAPKAADSREILLLQKPRNIGELFSLCHRTWDMQPNEVLKELGIGSKEAIADVADAWRQMIALKETPELGEVTAPPQGGEPVGSKDEAPPLDEGEPPF